MSKPLHHQFEDDLGELVDRYLREGIGYDVLKKILRYEADYDHAERHRELLAHADDRGEPDSKQ